MKRIEKHLVDLNCSEVDFDGGNWSWGRGGLPLQDWEFSINHVADDADLTETRYKLPECISYMLRQQTRHGGDTARQRIQAALNHS